MRKAILSSIVALAFLAGCEAPKPKPPKWEGPPYRLTLGAQPANAQPAKSSLGGLMLQPIYFTANPDAVQTRANLVIKINADDVKKKPPKFTDELLLVPADIGGKEGQLTPAYMDMASTEFSKMLVTYGMNGKVKAQVALVKSSIMMSATDVQVDNHRLSDWMPIEVDFKNPRLKN